MKTMARRLPKATKPEDLRADHPLRHGAICWPVKLKPSTEKPSTEDESQPSPESPSVDTGDAGDRDDDS